MVLASLLVVARRTGVIDPAWSCEMDQWPCIEGHLTCVLLVVQVVGLLVSQRVR